MVGEPMSGRGGMAGGSSGGSKESWRGWKGPTPRAVKRVEWRRFRSRPHSLALELPQSLPSLRVTIGCRTIHLLIAIPPRLSPVRRMEKEAYNNSDSGRGTLGVVAGPTAGQEHHHRRSANCGVRWKWGRRP